MESPGQTDVTPTSKVIRFEQTSDDPYDRHFYQIVTKSGKTFTYEAYDQMRAAWFQSCGARNLDRVIVLDAQQYKGFK